MSAVRGIDSEQFFDWILDGRHRGPSRIEGAFKIIESEVGIWGSACDTFSIIDPHKLAQRTKEIYLSMLDILSTNINFHLLRVWNYVPGINSSTPSADGFREVYHYFNRGRFEAYQSYFQGDTGDWKLPAASAVGTQSGVLRIEFLAVTSPPIFIENKSQVPARNYSMEYGPKPPLFARGAVFDNCGQRVLISAGTAAIKGEHSFHAGNPYAQLMESIDNLRQLISQFNLRRHDIEFGFGLEDLQLLRVYYRRAQDLELFEATLRQVLDPDCKVMYVQADICRAELLVEIEGLFLKKGEYQGTREKYQIENGKIRVESLELHIVEHCNIRCHMCDAMSPYNKKKFLTTKEIEGTVAFLAQHLRADIFKLMGGEPLLHPLIVEILAIVRRAKVTDTIRLTTNGLLLYRMPDAFWQSLDRLTVSNYSSAPMSAEHVRMAHDNAQKFGVILNMKYIDQFNGVMITRPIKNRARVQGIYNNCWIRHRSLVVRNGRFFKCTRAAYLDDFCREFKIERDPEDPTTFLETDGIPLDQNFSLNALRYLNAPLPLSSCRYCLGASGKLIPHRQMSREEVQVRYIDEGVFYSD